MNQGDEAGILIEFLYSRLRVNPSNWPVVPLPADAKQQTPCIGFQIIPGAPSNHEQGGDVMFAVFTVSVLCVGAENVDDLEPLRPMAKWVVNNLRTNNSQPGTTFGSGRILSAVQMMPATFPDRDPQGILRWHHGAQWEIRVQPDVLAS